MVAGAGPENKPHGPVLDDNTGRPVDTSPAETARQKGGQGCPSAAEDEPRAASELAEDAQRSPDGGEANLGWCDPMARSLLQWAQPGVTSPSPAPANVSPVILDQIAAQLVRKAGVGSSSVHLQFGAGRLEGGEVLVQTGADGLDVRITAPAGVDGAALAASISERLGRRGLRVARVSVD